MYESEFHPYLKRGLDLDYSIGEKDVQEPDDHFGTTPWQEGVTSSTLSSSPSSHCGARYISWLGMSSIQLLSSSCGEWYTSYSGTGSMSVTAAETISAMAVVISS